MSGQYAGVMRAKLLEAQNELAVCRTDNNYWRMKCTKLLRDLKEYLPDSDFEQKYGEEWEQAEGKDDPLIFENDEGANNGGEE